jgi:hypothetical protein
MPYFSATDVTALVLVCVGLIALYCGYRARHSPTMLPGKKAKLSKYGFGLGLALIGLAIFIYAREIMSPPTAEKIVQRERSQFTLPMEINAMIRWDSIEASGQRVTYVYTLRKTPRGISERFALIAGLRQQITDYICGDRLYRAAIKQHISFELIYKFLDETYPAITLSPGECQG